MSLTGHSVSNIVQARAQRSRNTHVPLHAARLHRASSGSAAGREPHLECVTSVFPLFFSADQKGNMLTRNLRLEANLLQSQVSKSNSVTQARRQHGWACEARETLPLESFEFVDSAGQEDPTPGRTLQERLRCRKKGSSTRLPPPLRRSRGNFSTFIGVPRLTRVSDTFEPKAPASRVQCPRCAVAAALLVAVDGGCAPAEIHRVR